MGFVRGRVGGKANVAVDTEGLSSGERRLDKSLIRNVSLEKGLQRSDWMGGHWELRRTRSLGGNSGIVSSFSIIKGVRLSTKESKSFFDCR